MFAVCVIIFLIFYVAPQHGTSSIFVYLAICSLAGSLSVMSCKVREGRNWRVGSAAWPGHMMLTPWAAVACWYFGWGNKEGVDAVHANVNVWFVSPGASVLGRGAWV